MINGDDAAFPRPYSWCETTEQHHWAEDGMTLRDYFAAAALTGVLSHVAGFDPGSGMTAGLCYAYADAMLAERAK